MPMLRTSMSITHLTVLQSIGFSHNHPLMDNSIMHHPSKNVNFWYYYLNEYNDNIFPLCHLYSFIEVINDYEFCD